MKLITTLFCWFSLVFLIGGCAINPAALENYPEREIDRPYTLTKSLHAYSATASFDYAQDNSTSGGAGTFNPLHYQYGINDDFNYIFPLIFAYQFFHNPGQTLGIGGGVNGFTYSSNSGLLVNSTWSAYYRYNTGAQSALELSLDYLPVVSNGTTYEGVSWSANLGVPVQLNDHFTLSPQVTGQWENGYSDFNGSHSYLSAATSFALPVGVVAHLNLSRHCELYGSYFYTGIATQNAYRDEYVSAKVVVYY